ncbi:MULTISPECIES: hypothetical protein [unclassified Moorena]|nr:MULTISPECIES: hypothetical protein [unclassified Moorena]NEO14652.1 hypothetical protein [Moorena sp. SIO3E8]NEQ04318.1 hypothetical protein [Moorena sp. SIO3F7]
MGSAGGLIEKLIIDKVSTAHPTSPDSRLPTPDSRFPTPHSRLPTPGIY